MPSTSSEVASLAELAALVLRSPPRLGATRLVAVDGPAGSGKTTVATRLAAALDGAPVVHMDDLYEGWAGLDDAVWERLLAGVLDPVAAGRPGRYRRYDWDARGFAEEVAVPVAAVLVVEGVGAGARQVDGRASLRVWVEAPRDERMARGLARDGEALRAEWLRWADREQAHFAADRTRDRAHVRLDGTVVLPDGAGAQTQPG